MARPSESSLVAISKLEKMSLTVEEALGVLVMSVKAPMFCSSIDEQNNS